MATEHNGTGRRAGEYPNTVTIDLLGLHPPVGKVAEVWAGLLATHPELDGARICEHDLAADLGLMLDVELERTMGTFAERSALVRAVGEVYLAEFLDRPSSYGPALRARFRVEGVLVWISALSCQCHPDGA